MQITLLSYTDVTPRNLALYREAAARLAVDLVEVEPHRLSCWVDGTRRVTLLDGQPFTPAAVIHRTVSPVFSVAGPALQLLVESGTVVLNDPRAAWASRDKLLTALALSRAGVPCVATLGITAGPDTAFPPGVPLVVTKPALGLRGEGVELHTDALATQARLQDMAPTGPMEHLVVQPQAGPFGSDLRAYVVDGHCIGLMRRTAPPGEFRANIANGATAAPAVMPEAEALAVAAVTALDLDHAGVDIVENTDGLQVLEVDAWAGFAGIEQTCSVDVAGAILTLAQARVR